MNNDIDFDNVIVENSTNDNNIENQNLIENNTINDTNSTVVVINDTSTTEEKLNLIHEDLGVICSFIVFFVLVILLKYAYKFFDMFFVI